MLIYTVYTMVYNIDMFDFDNASYYLHRIAYHYYKHHPIELNIDLLIIKNNSIKSYRQLLMKLKERKYKHIEMT